jgi:hypothetical protein
LHLLNYRPTRWTGEPLFFFSTTVIAFSSHQSPRSCNLFLSSWLPREITADGCIQRDSRRFPHLYSELNLSSWLTLLPSSFRTDWHLQSSPPLSNIWSSTTFWSHVATYTTWDDMLFRHLIVFILVMQSADIQDWFCHPSGPNSSTPAEAVFLHLQWPEAYTSGWWEKRRLPATLTWVQAYLHISPLCSTNVTACSNGHLIKLMAYTFCRCKTVCIWSWMRGSVHFLGRTCLCSYFSFFAYHACQNNQVASWLLHGHLCFSP